MSFRTSIIRAGVTGVIIVTFHTAPVSSLGCSLDVRESQRLEISMQGAAEKQCQLKGTLQSGKCSGAPRNCYINDEGL